MSEKRYWLHRVKHEGGLSILEKEKKLTIGFSDVRGDREASAALERKDYAVFCREYERVYGGEIWRSRNCLWRFVAEMKVDDCVVVPCPWGFYVCQITSPAVPCVRGELDFGWELGVEFLARGVCSPRDDYASTALLNRMKCLLTNVNIDDLKDDVEVAVERKNNNDPFVFGNELAKRCLSLLRDNKRPEFLEEMVAAYLKKLGGDASVQPRHYEGKKGDCDVMAVFEHLQLEVCVQCKRHIGATDDWCVKQISEFKQHQVDLQSNWTRQTWVISTADDFTDEAKRLAVENNVLLINGLEFCRRAIAVGAVAL